MAGGLLPGAWCQRLALQRRVLTRQRDLQAGATHARSAAVQAHLLGCLLLFTNLAQRTPGGSGSADAFLHAHTALLQPAGAQAPRTLPAAPRASDAARAADAHRSGDDARYEVRRVCAPHAAHQAHKLTLSHVIMHFLRSWSLLRRCPPPRPPPAPPRRTR